MKKEKKNVIQKGEEKNEKKKKRQGKKETVKKTVEEIGAGRGEIK